MSEVTSFEILKIKELSYTYKTLPIEDINTFDKNCLSIIFGIMALPDESSDVFTLNVKVTYNYKKDSIPDVELLSIGVEFKYKIGELPNILIMHGDKKFELPSGIMESMVGISLSTIRGMIAAKTAGNFLNNYPLPLINSDDLMAKGRRKKIGNKKEGDNLKKKDITKINPPSLKKNIN